MFRFVESVRPPSLSGARQQGLYVRKYDELRTHTHTLARSPLNQYGIGGTAQWPDEFLFFGLMMISILLACDPSTGPVPDPGATRTITGLVTVPYEDGPVPVPGADVFAYSGSVLIQETSTASDGAYTVDVSSDLETVRIVVSVDGVAISSVEDEWWTTDPLYAGAARTLGATEVQADFTFTDPLYMFEADFGDGLSDYVAMYRIEEQDNADVFHVANAGQLQAIALGEPFSLGGSGGGSSEIIIGLGASSASGGSTPALLEASYVLVRDIDLTQTADWNGGAGWISIGFWDGEDDESLVFTGSLDGQNFTIRGLVIDEAEDSGRPAGLFGDVYNTAEIRNLRIEDASFHFGHESVGPAILASSVSGIDTLIQNVHVTGEITGDSRGGGGIVGYVRYWRTGRSGERRNSADYFVQRFRNRYRHQ
ncbi:MAG: hypothetical protein EA383_02075 [Spirochaetaceae bacterium]|nr:MAG: hypothetical protein EA383_02075 [Spirochaetaceae bacterium]